MVDSEHRQPLDALLAENLAKYPNMQQIARAITSLPEFDRSALESEEFWSLVVALEKDELPIDVVSMNFDTKAGVLAATPTRLVLVIQGDGEGLVNTASIPYSEVVSVRQEVAEFSRRLVVLATDLTWTFEDIARDHASRFAVFVANSAGRKDLVPPSGSLVGSPESMDTAPSSRQGGSEPSKHRQSTNVLSPTKIVVGAIVLLVVVVGACTAAVGCNDCESAWDKCARGDCSDWDRITDNGRSDRCDELIRQRFR